MGIIQQIKNMYQTIFKTINFQTEAGKKLHETAIASLGLDMGDSGYGDEVDCAISVNNVNFKAFRDYVGGDISTLRMYYALQGHWKYVQVDKCLAGDIVISPTGLGNGKVSNGHVGIVSYGDNILSNNSETGLFDAHLTRKKWQEYYVKKGGYPMLFYRRTSF